MYKKSKEEVFTIYHLLTLISSQLKMIVSQISQISLNKKIKLKPKIQKEQIQILSSIKSLNKTSQEQMKHLEILRIFQKEQNNKNVLVIFWMMK
jgi:hypothetical protein